METTFFVLWYRLDGADRYLIWFSGERDGVVINPNQQVLSFPDRDSAYLFANLHGITIKVEEPILHNLDKLASWLRPNKRKPFNSKMVLTAWNLFIDVQASVEGKDILRETPGHDDLYTKVFWGNNLPSLTPPGKHFSPVWTSKETHQLRLILKEGLLQFRQWVKFMERDDMPTEATGLYRLGTL